MSCWSYLSPSQNQHARFNKEMDISNVSNCKEALVSYSPVALAPLWPPYSPWSGTCTQGPRNLPRVNSRLTDYRVCFGCVCVRTALRMGFCIWPKCTKQASQLDPQTFKKRLCAMHGSRRGGISRREGQRQTPHGNAGSSTGYITGDVYHQDRFHIPSLEA